MNTKHCLLSLLVVVAMPAFADIAIETETAQIGKKGDIGFSQAIEYEDATDGTGYGTVTQFEYGISDRAEILIEPFFYLLDKPSDESSTDGRGDIEITPSYMVIDENSWVPAVLVAMKLKVPTGSKQVEGSGKYDYYPYLIFGQHYAEWTFNANIGVNYANMGDKTDTPLGGGSFDKTIVWDLEAEKKLTPTLTGFYEVYSAEDGLRTVSTALEYHFTESVNAFMAVGYNEEDSVILRPGFNIDF